MEKGHIKSVLNEVIRTNNFNLISQNLSFEEKIWLTSTTENIESVIDELDEEDQQILYNVGFEVIFKKLYKENELSLLLQSFDNLNELNKALIILSMSNDELKVKYLDKVTNENYISNIIFNFESDELKVKYLDKLTEENYIFTVIFSFKSDELKIKYLDKLTNKYHIFNVISSFKSDELKVKYLDKLTDEGYISSFKSDEIFKFKVISSFKSDELKVKYLDKLTDENYIFNVISSFKSDELKIEYLDKLADEESKINVISKFKSDELKIKYLDKLTDEHDKSIVISSFESDELKIKYLDKLTDEHDKSIVISSFESDELKIEYLDKLTDEYYKSIVISSFESDELKIKYLDKLADEKYKSIVISSFKSNELKIEYLDKLTDERYKTSVISKFKSDELKLKCFDKLANDNWKVDVLKSIKSDALKINFLDKVSEHDKSLIITTLTSDETKKELLDKISSDIEKLLIISSLGFEDQQKYFEEIDKKNGNLKKIKDIYKIGYKEILELCFSASNQKLFKGTIEDDEKFAKFIAILNTQNAILEKKHIDTMLEAFLSKKFALEKNDIWNIFSTIKGMSDRKEVDNITKELINIIQYCQSTKNLVGKDLKDFLDSYVKDKSTLSKFIIELIDQRNPLVREKALDKLKTITSQYINLQMEDYKIKRKAEIYDQNVLKIERKVERNYLIKYIVEDCSLDDLIDLFNRTCPEKLDASYLNNPNGITIKEVLEWKKNNPSNAPKEIKSYFKVLNNIFGDLYIEHYEELFNMIKFKRQDIKYDTKYEIDNSSEILKALKGTNINELFELFLPENDAKYQIVLKIIEKYHIIGMGSNFDSIFESINMSSFDLIYFINNILKLATQLEKSNQEIKLVEFFDILDSFDKKSHTLLGKENAILMATNPGPNFANLNKTERLNQVSAYLRKMYARDKINIPAIDESIKLSSGNIINVNVGNFTNPINLTYGERTGACMRIGGVGKDLFDFCIENPAGFHIRFSSEDGKFVSRVSGFRKGNTVFLNELRNSVLEGYSDQDVIEACKIISNEMIKLSQNSESPIENVVVANQYVLSDATPNVDFETMLPKDGITTPKYYDIDPNRCVLLATSNRDQTRGYVPFKNTTLPEYFTLRDNVKFSNNSEEIKDLITRVKMINEVLAGKDFSETTIDITNNEYLAAYVGQDFYVAVDKDGKIESYIMPNAIDKNGAEKERNQAMQILKQRIYALAEASKTITKENESVGSRGSRGQITFLMMMFISFILSITTIIIGIINLIK